MIEEKKRTSGLNARALQWIALLLMLIDHAGRIIAKPIDPAWYEIMTSIGRLAFPIFAFQIAEGCIHTSNFKKYALRLAVFAIIAEIPFNMMETGLYPLNWKHQNVLFTLLVGLLVLRLLLWVREKNWGYKLLGILAFAAAYIVADLDYRGIGVTIVVMFGLSKELKYRTAIQILALFLLNYCHVWMYGSFDAPKQLLAVFAMLPIALYNGNQGPKNKFLQYGAYLFYPAHISVLVIARYLLVTLN